VGAFSSSTLDIAAASVGFAWLRLALPAAVWTVAILHASHNLFLQEVFDPLTVNRGEDRVLGRPSSGSGSRSSYGVVAWWCWRRRRLPLPDLDAG